MMDKFLNPALFFERAQSGKPGGILERIRSAWQFSSSRPDHQAVEKTTHLPSDAISEIPASEIRKTINGSVVTFEGTYLGKPIRVRIFNETPQEAIDI